ncbi:hypothetical protein LguiB_009995 [Lonicera macranthoides]
MDARTCFCGYPSILKTSWTDSNPGRRFLGCSRFGSQHGCGFFLWIDPPMCARSLQIISGLLRRTSNLQDMIERVKRREKWPWVLLCFSWVIIFFLTFRNNSSLNNKPENLQLL